MQSQGSCIIYEDEEKEQIMSEGGNPTILASSKRQNSPTFLGLRE